MAGAALAGVRALTLPPAPPVPTDLLQEWLPAGGSDLYYALLYAPAALRPTLTLLEAFRRHVVNVPLTCSNPDIARAKLAWWHGELHAFAATGSQHTLLRALAPLAAHDTALQPALFAVVDGSANLLDSPRFADAAARRAAYTGVHGPLWQVHARLCGLTAPSHAAALCRLGVAVELTHGLRDLRRVIAAGITWLCRTHEPPSRAETADADWYAAVAAREVAYLREELAQARAALPRTRACRPALVLGDLAETLLGEIAADGCRVWERRIDLTPLRKLWHALRVRSAT